MTQQYPKIPLLVYSDRLSARPGDSVAFKVSSDGAEPFSVKLMRSVSADPNPVGQGIVEKPVEGNFAPEYLSRRQAFNPGSYAIVPQGPAVDGAFTLKATIWPTQPGSGTQVILSAGGVELALDDTGIPLARFGTERLAAKVPLAARQWYTLELMHDPATGQSDLTCRPHGIWGGNTHSAGQVTPRPFDADQPVTIAAGLRDGAADQHFNGKIEAPEILSGDRSVAHWDFARDTPTTTIRDTGPQALDGQLINHPARAMIGSNWDGSEMCWRHKPVHYGAIHLHEDDIYDFGWETDLTWTVPGDLPTGVYVIRFTCGEYEDAVPLFVCPPKGARTADLAVLVSTFTYTVYGNNARVDYQPSWLDRNAEWSAYPWNPAEYRELGCSTYNFHTDGSGICHASHLRPLLNLRPGYLTYGNSETSGLRHFQADSHLIAWLHEHAINYDIITDRELHDEGASLLDGYKAVTTGSHPEYHTPQMLDALTTYRDNGGRLMYLGGNGFYWRVAIHTEEPSMIEIRRAEGGIRAWAAEPGEYFNAFDGGYGGLWRRNGRPPQQLVGVGFTAQGQFEGSYYRRSAASHDPDVAWIFDGIDDELLGDFGFSGGGAAGFELDRAETRLGSPSNVNILASSEGHGDSFVLVHEEQLTHLTTWAQEPQADLMRADMVYYDVPGGGAVFSTGSITFCGSLPWNRFDNNISHLLRNVVQRFLAG
ncbi:MAG: N,N-dimethylformamidase large subunit [Paracoccaceae bacterium]|nr:N,N-dimethylformamidase large subunit [Paracoccaceae bacterium]